MTQQHCYFFRARLIERIDYQFIANHVRIA